jgi:hypothetical protein
MRTKSDIQPRKLLAHAHNIFVHAARFQQERGGFKLGD